MHCRAAQTGAPPPRTAMSGAGGMPQISASTLLTLPADTPIPTTGKSISMRWTDGIFVDDGRALMTPIKALVSAIALGQVDQTAHNRP